ncbi:MAG: response regulator [Endomicrobiales bacterium]|nr:response regulator [Endomicrobiales bacterium]
MYEKVMIVEDEESMFDYLKFGLEMFEYNVVGTTDALKAIEMAHREMPDIVILDFIMPGIDGFCIARGLNTSNITRRIPILFITGKPTEENLRKIAQVKSHGYIPKPFEIQDLVKRIKRILSMRELVKQTV